jgi:hypothetical protein
MLTVPVRKNPSRVALNGLIAILLIPLSLKLAEVHPALGLAIPGSISGYLAFKSLPLLKTRRGQVAAVIALVAAVFLTTEPASAAISFSLLFAKTEDMMKTCIFNQVEGFNAATFLMVAPMRLMFMVPIGLNIAEFNKKRQQRQDPSDELMAIAYAIVGILVIGLIEPLVVRACG